LSATREGEMKMEMEEEEDPGSKGERQLALLPATPGKFIIRSSLDLIMKILP
jgi:hypothetical protein